MGRDVSARLTVGLLGFGEVGQVLADDLVAFEAVDVRAYDTQFATDGPPAHAVRGRGHVRAAASAADLAAGCDVVISAVTAAEDVAASRSIAGALAADAYVLDLNSVAPRTRHACAGIIEAAGGRYVEAAVMAPIAPQRIRSPILLGGAHSSAFLGIAGRLGFEGARAFSADIGPASATKMCRSVIVKGMEALVMESLLAARRYGVEQAVLESLGDLMRERDWQALARYLIGRSVEHGVRRAEEMHEVAATVEGAGVEPLMSRASAARQAWAAQFPAALAEPALQAMLDAIHGQLRGDPPC